MPIAYRLGCVIDRLERNACVFAWAYECVYLQNTMCMSVYKCDYVDVSMLTYVCMSTFRMSTCKGQCVCVCVSEEGEGETGDRHV